MAPAPTPGEDLAARSVGPCQTRLPSPRPLRRVHRHLPPAGGDIEPDDVNAPVIAGYFETAMVRRLRWTPKTRQFAQPSRRWRRRRDCGTSWRWATPCSRTNSSNLWRWRRTAPVRRFCNGCGSTRRSMVWSRYSCRRDERQRIIRYSVSGTVPIHVSDSFVLPSMSHTQTSPSVAWCHRMSALPSPL